MDALDELLAKPGDNRPPPLELLRDELEAENEALLRRKDELLGAVARMPDIASDETAGKVADLIKMITACAKKADSARVSRKEPFLEGGRAVDGYFKARILDQLDKAKKGVEAKLGVYLRAKADRERRAREEADRIARQAAQDAADQAAKAADAMRTEKDLDKAMDLARQAEEATAQAAVATKAAAAKPADLSRTRGDAGALGTLQARWTFKDIDRNSVNLEMLRNYLSVDEIGKAVRLYIKAMGAEEMKRIITTEGRQPIKGVTIYEEHGVSVR